MAPRVFRKPPIDVADVIRGAVTFNVPSFDSADTMDSGLTPEKDKDKIKSKLIWEIEINQVIHR